MGFFNVKFRRGKSMPRLTVKKKTGYRNVTGKPIRIYDDRGIIFYDTSQYDNIIWHFNLPPGTYFIESGKFREMARPVEYPLASLPAPEYRNAPNIDNFDVVIRKNPHVGSVHFYSGTVVLDENLVKNRPRAEICLILLHEKGHQFYATEEYCDRYAANQMLRMGYNPEQIAEASILTLSDGNNYRKELQVAKAINL